MDKQLHKTMKQARESLNSMLALNNKLLSDLPKEFQEQANAIKADAEKIRKAILENDKATLTQLQAKYGHPTTK